jgi:hypothetical protein
MQANVAIAMGGSLKELMEKVLLISTGVARAAAI